jgi:HEAT repeat protein
MKDRQMPKPLDAALKNITHADSTKRQAAAKSLGKVNEPQSVDTLITMLNDSDEDVREAAASSLVTLNDERAIEPLIACFIDPQRKPQPNMDGHVSNQIALSIKHFGPKAVAHLLPYLNDPVDAWQKNIVWLLAEIADPSTVQPLIDAHNATEEGAVRYSIKEALKKINSGPARAFIGSLKKRW